MCYGDLYLQPLAVAFMVGKIICVSTAWIRSCAALQAQ
jgi:hypothetical protein